MSWSRSSAAYSNSSIFAASRIFFSSLAISSRRSAAVIFTPSVRAPLPFRPCSSSGSSRPRTLLIIVLGTMPWALL